MFPDEYMEKQKKVEGKRREFNMLRKIINA